MRTTSETREDSSSAPSFPFTDDRVPFILVFAEGGGKEGRGFDHASTRDKKLGLLEEAQKATEDGLEVSLLAAWPGGKRTDVFLVDNYDEALATFG